MILDTSFLIDLMDGRPQAVTEARRLDESGTTQRIPAQVVYELYVGVGYTDQPREERRKIQAVLDSRPVEETTPEIAKLAGRVNGELKRAGQTVATGDMLIGTIARHYDEPVLTGTPGDFEPIPDVAVRTYQ
ncbi:MAG: type II toxin-antitoxin system VapC family toxin [Haloarculaceae archaeon]